MFVVSFFRITYYVIKSFTSHMVQFISSNIFEHVAKVKNEQCLIHRNEIFMSTLCEERNEKIYFSHTTGLIQIC